MVEVELEVAEGSDDQSGHETLGAFRYTSIRAGWTG